VYTGIVKMALPVAVLQEKPGLKTLRFRFPDELRAGLEIGASVAVDGVCLTVASLDGDDISFDVMQQTLSVTTLGDVRVGKRYNIERSARMGDEIGGHPISGHIDCTTTVVAITEPENNRFVDFAIPQALAKYIFPKGFIALNGCSLTVAEVDTVKNTFRVCFIPETLRVTTHGEKRVGDRINIEIDRQTQAIVDTVERYLAQTRRV
jgi:riboflavin synthase